MHDIRPLPSETLGSFLRRARETAGMSCQQVGNLAGVSDSSIVRIELGEIRSPRLDILKRLANVLEIDLADLFALSGVPIAPVATLADYLNRRAGFRLPEAAIAEADAALAAIVEKYRQRPKAS